VSGETNKIGLITNCNSGASRIFGYTSNEMRNHNVEKLMPEMYARNHSKILDEALAKGPENIPNKERLVFARHKSGYIFPVWLQLKMVSGATHGIQFVALFKIDKKLITSDIAYILINKDKKLQGLSSSCMPIMNLDISKMRKLSLSGINITKLAPKLFKDNILDQNY
jgi:PAS domain S-box-containing protein